LEDSGARCPKGRSLPVSNPVKRNGVNLIPAIDVYHSKFKGTVVKTRCGILFFTQKKKDAKNDQGEKKPPIDTLSYF
jgi:hypothetical protein